jgi:hypothetical protein
MRLVLVVDKAIPITGFGTSVLLGTCGFAENAAPGTPTPVFFGEKGGPSIKQ